MKARTRLRYRLGGKDERPWIPTFQVKPSILGLVELVHPFDQIGSKIRILLLVGALSAGFPAFAAIQLGSRLELFADDFMIERQDGVKLKLQEPKLAGVVLKRGRDLFAGT
jgi:hypothetical protein